jgi:hypothetical protein
VRDVPWETWRAIDTALRRGYRGCRKGDSLLLVFHRHRGRPLPQPVPRPRLTVRKVLAWADAHRRRTGRWPSQHSGPINGCRYENWGAVNNALFVGTRGLLGRDSIAKILLRYRDVRRARYRPRLTIKQILAWADKYHARNGHWPSFGSGVVQGAPGERWAAIHSALENASRGLPPGYTLAKLLEKYRGVPYKRDLPRYIVHTILAWADAFHRRHGRWPTLRSGAIPEARGESWLKVEGALSKGRRGLPGGSSLARLLERCGRHPRRNRHHHPARHTPLTIEQILTWADQFYRRNGRWPARLAGSIAGARDETWLSVDTALRQGLRGLTRGSSVARLLEQHRGVLDKLHRPRLTMRNILGWADAHHRRTRRWPTGQSGPIPESSGDTWCAVDQALHKGLRGLPGQESLTRFLKRHGRFRPARPA